MHVSKWKKNEKILCGEAMHPFPRGTFDRRRDLRAESAQPQVLDF
jgi:hypothetical protein